MYRLYRQIQAAFHDRRRLSHKIVEGIVWSLIIISVLLFAQEMIVGHDVLFGSFLNVVDRVILWLFALELTLRILTFSPPAAEMFRYSPPRLVWAHVYGRLCFALRPIVIVDILTVVALVPALRGLRGLRLLRLFRTTHIFRYSHPLQGLGRAFQDNQLLFGVATLFFGAAVGLGGVTLYLVEKSQNANVNTIWDGIWWALVTITTVGFGDISPETSLGRLVGGVVMILGMFTLAMFAGILGQSLLSSVLTIREEQFRMSGYLNHLVVCGFEANMEMLLGSLRHEAQLHQMTVVLFANGERPSIVPPEFVWVSGDPTKANQLDKVRLTHASGVIIIGSRRLAPNHADAITILTAFTIRRWIEQQPVNSERQKPLYIVAEILDLQNSRHAYVAGADEIIETTQLGCDLMAHAIAMPGTAAALSQVVKSRHPSLFIGPLFPSGNATEVRYGALVGALRQEHGVIVIGIKDLETKKHILMPDVDLMVCRGTDVLYLASAEVQPHAPR